MRRAALWLTIGVATACTVSPRIGEDNTVCAEARAVLGSCGVTLTVVQVRECTGPSQAVAQCVVDHGATCEDLADVRFDECASEVLDPLVDDPLFEPPPANPSDPLPDPPDNPNATEDTDALCDDGIDNDGDGFIDCADAGCSHGQDVTVCSSPD